LRWVDIKFHAHIDKILTFLLSSSGDSVAAPMSAPRRSHPTHTPLLRALVAAPEHVSVTCDLFATLHWSISPLRPSSLIAPRFPGRGTISSAPRGRRFRSTQPWAQGSATPSGSLKRRRGRDATAPGHHLSSRCSRKRGAGTDRACGHAGRDFSPGHDLHRWQNAPRVSGGGRSTPQPRRGCFSPSAPPEANR
jgi:hypothetical protein